VLHISLYLLLVVKTGVDLQTKFLFDATFYWCIGQEVTKLHENGIQFRVIGDLSKFEPKIIEFIHNGEQLTARNTRLTFTIAANYGGRWDIMQAMRKMMAQSTELPLNFDEENLAQYLSMSYAPEPDLFIRTGGSVESVIFVMAASLY